MLYMYMCTYSECLLFRLYECYIRFVSTEPKVIINLIFHKWELLQSHVYICIQLNEAITTQEHIKLQCMTTLSEAFEGWLGFIMTYD